jgi:hypothetical protein
VLCQKHLRGRHCRRQLTNQFTNPKAAGQERSLWLGYWPQHLPASTAGALPLQASCQPPLHCRLLGSLPLLQEMTHWHLLLLASHPIWSLYAATPPVLWDCAHLPQGRWDPSRQLWRQDQAQPGQLQYNPSAFFFNMILWRRDTVSRVCCLDLHAYSNSWTGGQAAGPVGCWAGAFHDRHGGRACGRKLHYNAGTATHCTLCCMRASRCQLSTALLWSDTQLPP